MGLSLPSHDDLSRLIGELSGKMDLLLGVINSHRDEQVAASSRLGQLEQRVASLEASKRTGLNHLTTLAAFAAIGATIIGYFVK